jgi:hypothetical protein
MVVIRGKGVGYHSRLCNSRRIRHDTHIHSKAGVIPESENSKSRHHCSACEAADTFTIHVAERIKNIVRVHSALPQLIQGVGEDVQPRTLISGASTAATTKSTSDEPYRSSESESEFTCRWASVSRNSRRYSELMRFPFTDIDTPYGLLM